GPAMLTRNLDVTYSMVWVIVISNIIAVGVSFLFLNQLVRLTYVKAPLLLALVLGDIAERYLFLSYSLYEWSWVTRPLVIAFALVTVGGLLWPLLRGRRHSSGEPVASRADIPITIGFLAIGIVVLLDARAWPFRTAVFPLATGVLLVGLSLVKLAAGPLKRFANADSPYARDGAVGGVPRGESSEGPSGPGDVDDVPDVFATATRREWAAALGWMASFFVALWLVGALITVPVFAVVYLLAVPRSSPVLAGVYALASWAFVY